MVNPDWIIIYCGGVSVGIGIGVIGAYLFIARPLIQDIKRLRYDGFRPEAKAMPQRPMTVPRPKVNET